LRIAAVKSLKLKLRLKRGAQGGEKADGTKPKYRNKKQTFCA